MGYIIYKYGISTFSVTIIIFKIRVYISELKAFNLNLEKKGLGVFFFFIQIFAFINKNSSLQSQLYTMNKYTFHCFDVIVTVNWQVSLQP